MGKSRAIISTWGSSPFEGNGMLHFLDTKLFGGNVGHARLDLRIPNTPENLERVKALCQKEGETIIPYRIVSTQIKEAARGKRGRYSQSDDVIREEEMIEINWSWWPAEGDYNYYLRGDIQADYMDERDGHHVKWDEERVDAIGLRPEKRMARGSLGSRKITLSPHYILHKRNLSGREWEEAQKRELIASIEYQLEAIDLLFDKQFRGERKNKLGETVLNILENVVGTDWPKLIGLDDIPQELSDKQIDLLESQVEKTERRLKAQKKKAEQRLREEEDSADDYVVRGTPASDTMKLSVRESQDDEGLDPFLMLKEMRSITDGEKFDLNTVNCSKTLWRIVCAGITDSNLRAWVDNEVYGFIGNPQTVFNNAYLLDAEMRRTGLLSRVKRAMDFRPLFRTQGFLLKVLLTVKYNRLQKFGAGVGIFFLSPLIITNSLVRAIMNPAKTFETLIHLNQYAWSRPSKLLRGVIGVFTVPFIIAFALPAAIQKAGEGAISMIGRLFSPSVDKEVARKMDEEIDRRFHEKLTGQSESDIIREMRSNQETHSAVERGVKKKVIEISGETAEEALRAAESFLEKPGNRIVTFDQRTEKRILSAMHKGRKEKRKALSERYGRICGRSQARARKAQSTTLLEREEAEHQRGISRE